MPEKPVLRDEKTARAEVAKWLHKPEHTRPRPGQEAKTASDDYEDRKNHHLPAPAVIHDDPAEV
jgi:hypothetical protein